MINTPLCFKIFVRYARKPIWMPTAPSKLFRISEHTFYKPEEVKQIRVLQEAYRAQEVSLQELMRHEFYIPSTKSGGLPPEFIEMERERDKIQLEENNRENAEVAKEREKFMTGFIAEMEEKVMEEKLKREEELMEIGEKIDRYIDQQKLIEDSFVTPDNFDRMIEKALTSQVSYEYCIDIAGRKSTSRPEIKRKV